VGMKTKGDLHRYCGFPPTSKRWGNLGAFNAFQHTEKKQKCGDETANGRKERTGIPETRERMGTPEGDIADGRGALDCERAINICKNNRKKRKKERERGGALATPANGGSMNLWRGAIRRGNGGKERLGGRRGGKIGKLQKIEDLVSFYTRWASGVTMEREISSVRRGPMVKETVNKGDVLQKGEGGRGVVHSKTRTGGGPHLFEEKRT